MEWKNYGDVNPIEHGGVFLKEDNERQGCFYIQKVNRIQDNGKFLLQDLYVDVNDSWIEKDKVVESCDILEDDEIEFALACTWYYNSANFGTEKVVDTEEEVKEYFKERGIEL